MKAALIVNAAIAEARSIASFGNSGSVVSPRAPSLVMAVSISSRGFAVDTGQSLPNASLPPALSTLPIGNIH